jgi:thiamine-monophosphate kinase
MKDENNPTPAEPAASSKTSTTIRSEFDFIRTIRDRSARRRQSINGAAPSSFIPHPSSLLLGIGDDAAVLKESAGRNTLVTTDLLVEDIDFHRDTTTPSLLGHKALAISVSDIAAMGARPRWALLSLGVPDDIWNTDFLEKFYEGFFALADRYGITLIGGDVSRTPERIVIDSILIGHCADGRAILRSGAQAGDQIFVTGSLGGSAAGLRLLERGARLQQKDLPNDAADSDSETIQRLLHRHLRPEPRVGWGLVLGDESLATAMIDISDGLSSDLNHLCDESGVGALIQAAKIPIDSCVAEICGRRALDPLLLALNGGEDFELLFTVSPQKVSQLPKRVDGVSISQIGVVTVDTNVRITEKDRIWVLTPGGYDHFRRGI